jgi:hypothetical protein
LINKKENFSKIDLPDVQLKVFISKRDNRDMKPEYRMGGMKEFCILP